MPQISSSFTPTDHKWILYGGILALFLYAGGWLLNIHASRNGESLMVLFFLLSLTAPQARQALLKEPIIYILIAWVLFQVGIYQWSAEHFPGLKSDHIGEARTITNVFLFVVTAWWFGGSDKRIAAVIALCATGYLIGATFQDGGLIDEWEKLERQARLTLGYKNWEHASVYSAFVLIALVTLRKRIINLAPERFRAIAAALLYAIVAYAVVAIIATQTRATWLGLLVTSATLPVLYLYSLYAARQQAGKTPSRRSLLKKGIVALAALGVLAGTLIATDSTRLITKRIQAEQDVINKLLEGETENIRMSSIGIRIKIWSMGIDWFQQRPITGWGPQSRKALFLEGDQPQWVKKHIRHLHNTYLDLLVNYGIAGLALFAGLFAYVWFRAWQAWKANIVPNDIMLFAALWSIYWLVVNMFESYVIYSATGPYLIAIVGGILYSYHLRHKLAEP